MLSANDRISALPPELLVTIFNFGAHAQRSTSNSYHARRGRLFGVCVTHVSRLWRDVALDTPSIWSVIDVRTGDLHQPDLIIAMLDRSRNHALDVTFNLQMMDKLSDDQCAALKQIMESFGPHITRTRRLNIQSDAVQGGLRSRGRTALYRPAQMVTDPMATREAPILEALQIVESTPSGSLVVSPAFLLSGGTPALKSLTWIGFLDQPSADLTRGLRSLHLGTDISYGALCRMLVATPALQSLTLLRHPVRTFTGGSSKLMLRSLRALSLVDHGRHVYTMCTLLSTPHLVTLDLSGLTSSSVQDIVNPFTAAAAVSVTSSVRCLKLRSIQVPVLKVHQFLQAFPALEQLDMSSFPANDFVSALTPGDPSVTELFAPRLRRVLLTHIRGLSTHVLERMVASRARWAAPIHLHLSDRLLWEIGEAIVPMRFWALSVSASEPPALTC